MLGSDDDRLAAIQLWAFATSNPAVMGFVGLRGCRVQCHEGITIG